MIPSNLQRNVHILHFNDAYQIQVHKDEPVGGTPHFLTAMKSFDQFKPLKFFSGDLFSPADLTPIFEGSQLIVPINEMHLTAACLGNHDFDLEYDTLQDLLKQTNCPWIMTNMFLEATNLPVADCKEYLIVESGGFKIGVIGLAEEEWLGTLMTLEREDIKFLDPIETARTWCTILKKDMKCDLVVALTHMRVPNDRLLAKEVQELDLCLGGHDHIVWMEQHGEVVAVKSGTDFRNLGHIKLEEVAEKPEKLEPFQYFIKGKYLITVNILNISKNYEPDPVVQKHVDDCLENLKKEFDVLVGFTDADLEGRFSRIRMEETNLCNFIADICLGYTNADFFIGNTGTIRHDAVTPAGPIKFGDIKAMLPFEDYIEVAEIEGKMIKDVLEVAVGKYPAMEGRFPMVAGIAFAFDPRKPTGDRVELSSIIVAGKPLVPEKKYQIASKYFMLSGGRDGYDLLKTCKKLVTHEFGIELTKILLHFFAYQPRAKEVMQAQNLEPGPGMLLRRKSSLTTKTKCLERTKHLIQDKTWEDTEMKEFIHIGPKVEGRIINLAPMHSYK